MYLEHSRFVYGLRANEFARSERPKRTNSPTLDTKTLY